MGAVKCILAVLLAVLHVVICFNVDISEPIVFRSQAKNDYFGFTVALHSYGDDKWLLVGAPLANQTAPFGSRFKIHERYGGVFKCRPRKNSACETIPIDTTDPLYQDFNGEQIDIEEKAGQWLGASLFSTGQNGKAVACAPRYTFRGNFINRPEKRPRNVIGRCFLIRDDLRGLHKRVSPCYHGSNGRELMYGYGQDGMCQAGFSTVITNDDTLGFGAVGVGYGKGMIGAYFDRSDSTVFARSSDLKVGYFGDVFGYTMTAGRFKRSGKEQLIGSSPRADDIRGRVMAFDVVGDEQIKVSFTLPLPPDNQPGSAFGFSMCAVDLNNDGLSDLLVGAPRYSYDKDEGRVYVYVNNGLVSITIPKYVVVGAPYGGPDRRGAVYIYHGTKDGIDTKYRQRVTASDMNDPALKTFGYSLTGGLDMDDNSYPDVAVGAYSSDRAVLLRSRPIVDVVGKIELSTNRIILESNQTNLCTLQGNQHKCLTARVCLKYKHKVPVSQGVELDFSLALDQDRRTIELRRMFFDPKNTTDKVFTKRGSAVLTKAGDWHCLPEYKIFLRLREEIGDLLTALTFDLQYDLKKNAICEVCPILNDYDDARQRTVRAEAIFQKHCKDKVCVPDLSVSGSASFSGGFKDLRIGISQQMLVTITVENKAEDFAYPGKVLVTYPSFLGYVGVAAKQDVQCKRLITSDDFEQAVCLVGMPFQGKTKKTFDMLFATAGVKGNISMFKVDLEATSPGADANPSDNKVSLQLAVKFEADLSISGASLPDELVFSSKGKTSEEVRTERDIGPLVQQTIMVRNNGPGAVDGSEVTVSLPWKKSEEDLSYLLYLLSVQVHGSAATCDVKTNPLNIKMSNNTDKPAVLESTSRVGANKRTRKEVKKGDQLSCDNVKCLLFTCRLGKLEQGEGAEIIMTSRLWQDTLVKAGFGSVDLITKAAISPPPSITEPPNDNNNQVLLSIRANPKESQTPSEPTPTWIIIVSVLAGLILLGLLVFGLYKAGFFKRKRPEEMANDEENTTKYEPAAQEPEA
ncbi:predicted protein [Nematostella vectensis]|uniref:Integrin alpha-2 domain-containing protein n=1 Tax=Nematostella vectensis TaxID=45351 RepID=A7RG71_NEMVE|nr:predicted protein [Nematostella vectensis]|eukprot:XP_001641435.1 predicted protein [Nematostella vectensis]